MACLLPLLCSAQAENGRPSQVDSLKKEIAILKRTELIQSMSQRSLLIPAYFPQLKALIARQSYNFWTENEGERLVSHLNVYAALYYANKFLGYDSINLRSYNETFGHNKSVVSIQPGIDPGVFYSAGSDGRVLKWQIGKEAFNHPEVIYEGPELIRSIDISDDGQSLLLVSKYSGIVILEIRPPDEWPAGLIKNKEPVQSAVFVPGESKVAMVTSDGSLKIMGFQTKKTLGRVMDATTSMAMNAKTKDIYVGISDGVQIWEDTLARKVHLAEAFAINAMALSPNQDMLAIGREKGDVILWDLNTKSVHRIISGHQSAITDVDFNADGTQLLTASRDRTVRVWDVYNPRKFPLILDDHQDWVMTACFDPHSPRIITGSRDNYLRFWPTEHEVLAKRICELIGRQLTEKEWLEYVGKDIPYRPTCE